MAYYHIIINYFNGKEDQALKDLEDLEYIKKYLILPYMRKEENFIFNGKNIDLSNIKGIQIYKSDADLDTTSSNALNRYPNIIGYPGYCYDLAEEITNNVFIQCHATIDKEKKEKKKKEKTVQNIKNIFFWVVCVLFILFTIYSVLCLFPFMKDYDLFCLMNLKGNAAKIIGFIIGPVFTILINKYLVKP